MVLAGILDAAHAGLPERFPAQSLVEDLQEGKSFGVANQRARGLNKLTLSMLKDLEGWRAERYDDVAGYCTIGYGHVIALQRCSRLGERQLGEFAKPISKKRSEQLLLEDLVTARLAVERLVTVELNDNEFGALTSFVFNVGKRHFADSTLLKKLNRGDREGASHEFVRWAKDGRRYSSTLGQRRACEADLFRSQLVATSRGEFSEAACSSFGAAPGGLPLIDVRNGER
ncbi:MAG: lysozyme [Myxococcota bacterium]